MTIDKAIKEIGEALKRANEGRSVVMPIPALKLGLEALKLIKAYRNDDDVMIDLPMPGETIQ